MCCGQMGQDTNYVGKQRQMSVNFDTRTNEFAQSPHAEETATAIKPNHIVQIGTISKSLYVSK